MLKLVTLEAWNRAARLDPMKTHYFTVRPGCTVYQGRWRSNENQFEWLLKIMWWDEENGETTTLSLYFKDQFQYLDRVVALEETKDQKQYERIW
jgi:hypothetical protein